MSRSSAAATASTSSSARRISAVIAKVREHGGEFAIGADGKRIVRNARHVPLGVVAAVRANGDAVEAALAVEHSQQVPLSFDTPSEARFRMLLAEYVVLADAAKAARR